MHAAKNFKTKNKNRQRHHKHRLKNSHLVLTGNCLVFWSNRIWILSLFSVCCCCWGNFFEWWADNEFRLNCWGRLPLKLVILVLDVLAKECNKLPGSWILLLLEEFALCKAWWEVKSLSLEYIFKLLFIVEVLCDIGGKTLDGWATVENWEDWILLPGLVSAARKSSPWLERFCWWPTKLLWLDPIAPKPPRSLSINVRGHWLLAWMWDCWTGLTTGEPFGSQERFCIEKLCELEAGLEAVCFESNLEALWIWEVWKLADWVGVVVWITLLCIDW